MSDKAISLIANTIYYLVILILALAIYFLWKSWTADKVFHQDTENLICTVNSSSLTCTTQQQKLGWQPIYQLPAPPVAIKATFGVIGERIRTELVAEDFRQPERIKRAILSRAP